MLTQSVFPADRGIKESLSPAAGRWLYANETFFGTCLKNDWRFIVTFKDGNLKTVWEEIGLLRPLHPGQKLDRVKEKNPVHGWLSEQLQYINDLDYAKYKLNRVEYKAWYDGKEAHEHFSHISDINIDKDNAREISRHGRLRWCIENEGFNTQRTVVTTLNISFQGKTLGQRRIIPIAIGTNCCRSHT